MASIKVDFPDDFSNRITRMGDQTDRIIEKTLKVGGDVVLGVVRSNLSASIGRNLKYKGRSTGELMASLGVSPVDHDRNGDPNLRVGFNEPRRVQTAAKGKRSYYVATNAMIANVLEYGRHGEKGKPFMKPAKISSRKRCEAVMKDVLEREMGAI
jgi:hypothetical protein